MSGCRWAIQQDGDRPRRGALRDAFPAGSWTRDGCAVYPRVVSEREEIRAALEAEPSVVFATLFGSRTKGTARADSDWDVAVYLDERMDAMGRLDVVRRLIAGLAPAIDVQVVILNEAPVLLAHRALQGERMLVRDPSAWVSFYVRTLGEAEDARYYLRIHERAMRQRLREGRFGRP